MSKATDVATVTTMRDALATATTYEDIVAYARENGLALESSEDYGDGVSVVVKSALINQPLILSDWKFTSSEIGEYVAVRGMTQSGTKFAFADGSAGIFQQLWKITEARTARGVTADATTQFLMVPKGLTASNYKTDEGVPATTYYLAD